MTKEILQQAQILFTKLEQTKRQLNQIEVILDTAKEDKVKTRVWGMDFDLPKASFRSEVMKRKTELDTQLATLQSQFDAL